MQNGMYILCYGKILYKRQVKYLFRTGTGKEFETVYIPDKKRNTVCVSTQSGCRMGCTFCATAKYCIIYRLNIYSEQEQEKSLKQFISLIKRGTQFVYQPSQDAEWDVHSVLRQNTV